MTIVYAIAVLGVLAIVFGLILAVAAKVFEVEVDPRLPEIQACLAGANCGGCGYPGCGGCAEAILAGKAPVTACAPAGPENAAKIAAIMGMEAPSGDKMVAHVLCNGGCNAKDNFEYRGVKDCLAATKVCGGDAKACKYGCFGFGSCVAACKFDAIHVVDGVAVVDKEKCTNCGACRAACPHHLIVEVPYKQKVFVNCSNKDKGPAVTKVCANSCIACGMCERTCKFDAIHVVDNVAVIDYSKCKNCTMCAKACPRNAIEPIPTPEEKEKFKAAQKAAAEKKAAAAKDGAVLANLVSTIKTEGKAKLSEKLESKLGTINVSDILNDGSAEKAEYQKKIDLLNSLKFNADNGIQTKTAAQLADALKSSTMKDIVGSKGDTYVAKYLGKIVAKAQNLLPDSASITLNGVTLTENDLTALGNANTSLEAVTELANLIAKFGDLSIGSFADPAGQKVTVNYNTRSASANLIINVK